MFVRAGLPLLVLVVIALIFVAFVVLVQARDRRWKREARLEKERLWDGVCEFDNPDTGAKCTREEFHLENHYHDLGDGRLVHWA